ncbi:GDP-mannose 4,6-dehydratase, partial [Candidatus Roizmanbacteria bacterium CG_4_9_14_0_2_um_filter_36_12]
MSKTALVTGILGQDGPYLAKFLLKKGYKVYGLIRRYSNPNFSNLDYLNITNDVDYVEGDMNDEASLLNLIRGLH